MKIRTLGIAALAAVLATAAAPMPKAPAPVAPTKPVELEIEAANMAGRTGKVAVTINASITKKDVGYKIEIIQSGNFDYKRLTVKVDSADAVIAALQQIAAEPDKDYANDAGGFELANVALKDGGRIVTVKEKREGLVFGNDAVMLETDGAETLANAIKKALGIKQWVAARAAAFQK
jgi:hypothetical protein